MPPRVDISDTVQARQSVAGYYSRRMMSLEILTYITLCRLSCQLYIHEMYAYGQ